MKGSDDPVGLTVVITLFNKRPYIRRTLRSALAQDHARYEIIVVDDGSTDGSSAAIEDLLGDRVRLLVQPNQGPGPARNRGVAEARFAWIALLDGDDIWLPDHLSTLAALIESFPQADAATTGFRRIASAEEAARADGQSGINGYLLDYFAEAVVREPMWTSSVAVRRRTLLDLDGFGTDWPGEDLDLWARLALDHLIAATPRETAFYTLGTGGLMDVWERRPREGYKPQPVIATLDAAIADSRYADRHGQILAYRNHLLRLGARQALYRGECGAARQYLDRLDPVQRPASLRYLALAPGPVALAASRLYSLAKRLARRRSGHGR